MPFVSIHDYNEGKVIVVEYDDSITDVEKEVVQPLVSGQYEYMCMNKLKLEVITNENNKT